MPTRMLKEAICTSPTLAGLSSDAERLLWRLLVTTDSYGVFQANPAVVLGQCAPLLGWTNGKVTVLLRELVKSGVICLFDDGQGRGYGHFVTFEKHNRLGSRRRKYPVPPPPSSTPQLPLERVPDPGQGGVQVVCSSSSSSSSSVGGCGGESEETATEPPDPEALQVCDALRESIRRFNPAYRNLDLDVRYAKERAIWLPELDKLERIDKRSYARQLKLLQWLAYGKSHQANFWRSNVRSAKKFREKFDALEGFMQIDKPGRRFADSPEAYAESVPGLQVTTVADLEAEAKKGKAE